MKNKQNQFKISDIITVVCMVVFLGLFIELYIRPDKETFQSIMMLLPLLAGAYVAQSRTKRTVSELKQRIKELEEKNQNETVELTDKSLRDFQ